MSTSKNNRKKNLPAKTPAEDNNGEITVVVDDLIKTDPSLKNIGPQNIKKIVVAMRHSEHFSGPLPHPEHLALYADLIDNGAERIMKQSEEQTEHRIVSERKIVNWTLAQGVFGQIFAFILAILFGIGGLYLTMHKHAAVGGLMIAAPVMTMIGAFLKYSRPNGN